MYRIGLVDVDKTHFPNLALMKIAAYHKQQGDEVEFANPLFGNYDRVYMSKIFTFTPDVYDFYDCEIVKGGTGYDITSQLPPQLIKCNRIILCTESRIPRSDSLREVASINASGALSRRKRGSRGLI